MRRKHAPFRPPLTVFQNMSRDLIEKVATIIFFPVASGLVLVSFVATERIASCVLSILHNNCTSQTPGESAVLLRPKVGSTAWCLLEQERSDIYSDVGKCTTFSAALV